MLQLRDLTVELDVDDGVVRAIDALDLSLRRGETFALVGESGCGKSMTALALMRLLPDNGAIVAGDVTLDDGRLAAGPAAPLDVLALPEARMRAVRGGRIGMIFQEPSTSLNPVMRVGDQIVEAIQTHTPLRGAAARAEALQWLRRVGIPEPERRLDDYPFRMSGGQKQRVMIAMTLAARPDFLIADEPTTALDVTIQAQILELLRELQRQQGMGLLLITHDLAVVSQMAHRVALMYAGQIVEVAPAAEFFATPRHPYAQALLRALPDASRRGQPLQAIAGTVPALTRRFGGCRFAPRCEHARPACDASPPTLAAVTPTHAVRCVRVGELEGDGQRPVQTAGAARREASGDAAALAVRAARAGAGGPGAAVASDGVGAQGETLPDAPWIGPAVAAVEPDGDDRGAPAADPRAAPLLEVTDLHVHFPTRRAWWRRADDGFHAVDGVSFTIGRGQTLALVGESGCGKTTTGKAIVQLLRRTAVVRGQARLDGRNLFDLQGDELRRARRDVQIIFQDPFASLNPRMRVAEILGEGLAALRPELDPAARDALVATTIERVGLRRDALERHPHEFSGGQRQRLAIARALAVGPRLIVCDEPTSALDVSVQAQILNLLRELQRELGVSYLFITHHIGVVEVLADRIAVMRAGRLVEQGPCEQVLARPSQPYTRELLAAVPRLRGS